MAAFRSKLEVVAQQFWMKVPYTNCHTVLSWACDKETGFPLLCWAGPDLANMLLQKWQLQVYGCREICIFAVFTYAAGGRAGISLFSLNFAQSTDLTAQRVFTAYF